MLETLLAADAAVRAWLSTHHTPALDALMLFLSGVGRAGLLWFLLALVYAGRHAERLAAAWQLVLAIGLTSLLVDAVLKPGIARDRPFDALAEVLVVGDRPSTYSFPSGHAANACAGAFALTRVWRRARRVLWTLALLVGLSRIYLGVHYPIDVIGGGLIGIACAAFVIGGRRSAFADLPERRSCTASSSQLRPS